MDDFVKVYPVQYWDNQTGAYAYPKKLRQADYIEKTSGMSVRDGALGVEVRRADLDDEGAYTDRGRRPHSLSSGAA